MNMSKVNLMDSRLSAGALILAVLTHVGCSLEHSLGCYQGSRYWESDSQMTYDAVPAYCNTTGGAPFTPRGLTEAKVIQIRHQKLGANRVYYIGVRYNITRSTWELYGGRPLLFELWDTVMGEPHGPVAEPCVIAGYPGTMLWQWHDVTCAGVQYAMCQVVEAADRSYGDLKPDMKLVGHVINNVTSLSPLHCANLCLSTTECQSANYYGGQVCEMNEVTADDFSADLQAQVGGTYITLVAKDSCYEP